MGGALIKITRELAGFRIAEGPTSTNSAERHGLGSDRRRIHRQERWWPRSAVTAAAI